MKYRFALDAVYAGEIEAEGDNEEQAFEAAKKLLDGGYNPALSYLKGSLEINGDSGEEVEEVDVIKDRAESYLAAGGNICLYCKSDNISGGEIEVSTMCARQNVSCTDCDCAWIDSYTLDRVIE